jgi:hypothetical protein
MQRASMQLAHLWQSSLPLFRPTPVGSRGSRHIDDKAEAESGERRLHLFHSGCMTQVEYATDLWEVPAQKACEFCLTDAPLAHRIVFSASR